MTSKILPTTWIFNKILQTNKRYTISKLSYSASVNAVKQGESKPGSTIDQEDVNRFTKHSKFWWDTSGPLIGLHSMNLLRVPFVRDGLVQCTIDERNPTSLKDKKILDVGCGGGILSEALAKIGAQVTGIDANKELIDVAQHHAEFNSKLITKPSYQCVTIEDHIKDRSNYYDGVVASEVIEHVNNQEMFVKSCVEAVKPGGRIFFTTFNRTRMAQIFGIYVAEYVLKIVPQGTHQYEKFITPNELTLLLERNNCHVEVINGTMYNVLKNEWEFVSSQRLMYALQAQKLEST